MSKKYGIMDKHFQIYNLKKHINSKNITVDKIDIHSLIDSTLHLPENINNIDKIIGINHARSNNYIKNLCIQ